VQAASRRLRRKVTVFFHFLGHFLRKSSKNPRNPLHISSHSPPQMLKNNKKHPILANHLHKTGDYTNK
jgi:hypothetical protein